jgi:AraC-like DNA-binding protein
MAEATIAAGFAKAFLDFAVSKGANRQILIERVFPSRTDIPLCHFFQAGTLDEESRTDIPVCHSFLTDQLDEGDRVPLANYIELMKAGIEFCHEPALALLFGEEVRLPDTSIVGALGRAETAEEARLQASRYSRLAIDEGDELEGASGSPLEFVREDGNVWLKFNSALYIKNPLLTETAFAHCVSGRGAMSGSRDGSSRWPYPKAFSFTHAEPSYRAEYDRIFGAPLVFGSDKNAILFGEELLSVRLPPMNRYVSRLLIQQGDALLTKLDSSKLSKSMRGRVEKLLLPILPTGEASVEIIAGKLGVSRQTLFRKLKAEGVTFEKVLDELRHTLALHYLDDKKMSVNKAAYLVGFSDAAAFSRAFKRWTGSSPRMSQAANQAKDRAPSGAASRQ